MPIGGAGNPVGGGNPVGLGTGINYIGNHAYAYNNVNQDLSTETPLLKFATGNEYIVAKINCAIMNGTSDDFFIRFKINGEEVFSWYQNNAGEGPDPDVQVIVAPQSNVELTVQNNSSSSVRPICAKFTGEVYA